MWISDQIEQHIQRQATGPVQHGHLQSIVGGKVADGLFAQEVGIVDRIRGFFTRKVTRVPLRVVAGK